QNYLIFSGRATPSVYAQIIPPSFCPELGAGDDRFDHAVETMALGGQPVLHGLDQGLIRQHQTSTERIDQKLAADVLNKVVLAVLRDIWPQGRHAFSLAAVGKGCPGFDRAVAEVLFASLADRAESFEDQPDRVEPLVAARTVLVGSVPREKLRQAFLAPRRFIPGKAGEGGRARAASLGPP